MRRKAAGRTLSDGIDIEIVVEAINSGSFKARISAIARQSGLFLANQAVPSLILGVLGSFIYDHTLAKKDSMQVQVYTDEVVITHGEDRIVVPREIHNATQLVEKNPAFVRAIDRMLNSVIVDERVTAFGLSRDMDSGLPELMLPRELLAVRDERLEEPKTRVVEEECDLYIIKAIMERSKRKWEFKWRGVNISAPIKDPSFYEDFAKHNFTIAPGDEFQVRLAIHQKKDDLSGVYANVSYEVLHVYRHVSRMKAARLPLELP